MKLTRRQAQVVNLLLDGLPPKAIAYQLGITRDAVYKRLGKAYQRNRIQSGRMKSVPLLVAYLREKDKD